MITHSGGGGGVVGMYAVVVVIQGRPRCATTTINNNGRRPTTTTDGNNARFLLRTFPNSRSVLRVEALLIILFVNTDAALSVSQCNLCFPFFHTVVDHAGRVFIPGGAGRGGGRGGEPEGVGGPLK